MKCDGMDCDDCGLWLDEEVLNLCSEMKRSDLDACKLFDEMSLWAILLLACMPGVEI